MVDPHLLVPARVLWVLLGAYVASATATIPKGRGPPMDFGRSWPWDSRRILGPSKSWSGFWFGTFIALLVGLFEAYLYDIAPPSLQLVPGYGSTIWAVLPVVIIISAGAMTGDAVGSFIKRRLGRPSGSRTPFLDQLPFVLVPIALGAALYPSIFIPTFFSLEALVWLLVFTLVLHPLFNWVGYKIHLKKVPW